MAAVVVERMLHRLDAVVAELVGARGEPQALVVVVRRATVFAAERRKEIDTELHRLPFQVSSSDARMRKRLCFTGSSAMARSSSKRFSRADGSRSSSRFLLAIVCSCTYSMLSGRRTRS